MKIAITIADANHMAMGGGEVERFTSIVQIPDESLSPAVKAYIKARNEEDPSKGKWCYLSASLSLVEEVK